MTFFDDLGGKSSAYILKIGGVSILKRVGDVKEKRYLGRG